MIRRSSDAVVESGMERPYSRERSSMSGEGCSVRWIVVGDNEGERRVERRDGAMDEDWEEGGVGYDAWCSMTSLESA